MRLALDGLTSPNTAGAGKASVHLCRAIISVSTDMYMVPWKAWYKKLCKRKSTKSRMALGKQSRRWAGVLPDCPSRLAERYARHGVHAALPGGTI